MRPGLIPRVGVRPQHQDVRRALILRTHLLRILENCRRRLGIQSPKLIILELQLGFHDGDAARRQIRLTRLLERLHERRLTGPRRASLGPDLRPAFAKQVAEFPARLHGGAEEFFGGRFALAVVLAQGKEHFGEVPAGAQEVVGLGARALVGEGGAALLHEAVAERDVEIERALAEGFGQGTIVRVVEVVIQLETNAKHRIRRFVGALTGFEEGGAEGAAEVQSGAHIGGEVGVARRVELLAELPAGFPGDALPVARGTFAEYARAVGLA